ncbi:MAG: hypothetical protein NC388_05975 [Clostridium sp.]|nr:hypothetical protein [Clostridium sp.]
MEQLTLIFDNASVKNRLLKVLELMKGVTIVKEETNVKNGLDKALDDVKAGRVYKAENADDMFKQILG